MSIEDGILLKGDRVCSLPKPYEWTLSDLHNWKSETFSKINCLLSWNRCRYNWLHQEISGLHQTQGNPSVQLTLPRDVPNRPWHVLTSDFFHFNSNKYLLLADTFSKDPFIYKTSSKTRLHHTEITTANIPIQTAKRFNYRQWTSLLIRNTSQIPIYTTLYHYPSILNKVAS